MNAHRRKFLQSPHLTDGYVGSCSYCGKRAFRDRKAAKLYARREYPTERMWAYRCPNSGVWHVGHPAAEVVSGEVPKGLFYGPGGVGEVRYKQGTRRTVKRRAA